MHWLEQLDITAFRFVNGTLSNPFFDKVMPFASGNVFFAPAVFVLAALLIWKGGRRGLVCALMIGLVVGVSDGFICKTIKHTVNRPRPFSVLPDVKRPGHVSLQSVNMQTEFNTNSMPSAHASNWAAAAMAALIYYRRSIRITLPLAILVGFSRVYNGVHYPSDVLAGAILGAGTAAATIWLLNELWQWAGPKWFVRAWKSMPSLVMPNVPHIRAAAPPLTDSPSA